MVRTVLIIEDGDNVTPLEIALSSLRDLRTLVLSSGREALTLLRNGPEGLVAVVTDLHLPGVDGFELIEAIRSSGRYSHLPIVVVSGDSHPDVPHRLRRLGADAFFTKPYSPAEILHTLEGLLNGS